MVGEVAFAGLRAGACVALELGPQRTVHHLRKLVLQHCECRVVRCRGDGAVEEEIRRRRVISAVHGCLLLCERIRHPAQVFLRVMDRGVLGARGFDGETRHHEVQWAVVAGGFGAGAESDAV